MKIVDGAPVYRPAAQPAESSRAPQPALVDAAGVPLRATPTGAWKRLAAAGSTRTSPIAARALLLDPDAERRAQLELLVQAYYPRHPRLHLFAAGFDVRAAGEVGRLDETGRLEKIVLGLPHALDGDWRASPLTRKQGTAVDLHQALAQHAALTRFLLERGVEVFLVAHPDAASEAVYATDALTGFGRLALTSNPDSLTRRLEIESYSGAVPLQRFADSGAPIEFGDVALAFDAKRRELKVVQGIGSERSNDASSEAMAAALRYLQRSFGDLRLVHVPIRLSGKDTLHLDFVANYAGQGAERAMVVYPAGLADANDVDTLARAFGVKRDARILTIESHDAMLRGAAANFSSLNPRELMMARNRYTAEVGEQLARLGFTVHFFDYDQMTGKDGSLHCTNGQLKRALPAF